jgi:pilus assembly protein TadC
MSLAAYLANKEPNLRTDLYKARMKIAPEAFVAKSLRVAMMAGLMFAVLVFFYVDKTNRPLWIPLAVFFLFTYGVYWYLLKTPLLRQAQIAVDIDREVLFAGRFLLVKLNSGKPLINALVEASKSYGVSNKYFLEIVRDIELGTPLEDAIEKAMNNSPSKHWRKILFQIHNALKLGIDVSTSLEAALEDVSHDYLIQIQRYGKKLGTMTLFYLLLAVVVPSLGMTIFTVLISFTGISSQGFGMYLVILVLLVFIQVVFMRLFVDIRPKVNL